MGYAGGATPSPTYRNMGDHTEVVQVDFVPAQVPFEQLLLEFWRQHNPSRPPYKRQYMSIILCSDVEQRERALASRDARAGHLGKELFTEISLLQSFTLAEDYHQKYYLRGDRSLFARVSRLGPRELIDSTEAARLNAYAGGYGVEPGAGLLHAAR